MVAFLGITSSRRSLGITMSVSTASRSSARPASAWFWRTRPSKRKGLVTTPTVRAPSSRATRATTGAAPVPVPPPMPAVTKTMSLPSSSSRSTSSSSRTDSRPTRGSPPEPSPRVT